MSKSADEDVRNCELPGSLDYLRSISRQDKNDPTWPVPSFDARDWAEAFHKQFPSVPEDVALAWFAGALMRGYDQHAFTAPRLPGVER